MKRGVVLLIIFLLVVSASNAFKSGLIKNKEDKKENFDYVPGEVIVKFKENPPAKFLGMAVKADSINSLNNKFEVKEMSNFLKNSRLYKLKVTQERDIFSVIDEYKQDPNVEYAEPNYIRHVFLEPNDMSSNQWNIPKINATLAWNITKGNGTVIIAVIDTGVDWNHPDLATRIWNNTDETANNELDDDNNGYLDDIRGYDFVDASSGCYGGEDCDGNEDNNPMDFHGHGTHVSGISAADTNNDVGIAGVCWNCTIMPIRAGYKDSAGNGVLTDADVSQALHYAADNKANIISMSFGGTNSFTLQEAIDYAYNKSVILVAAAGNSNTNDTSSAYPAAYWNVISVAATNSNDAKGTLSNSNYGSWIEIAAPGDSIYSTYYDDTYSTLSGTSMATPHIAGAIGLLLSYNSSLNQTQARDALVNYGDSLSNFGATGLTMPRLNIYKALLSLDKTAPNITFVTPTISNNTNTLNTSIFINITSNEALSIAILEWANTSLTNITMNGSATNWYYNKTGLTTGNYSFKVYGNDSAGNFGVSETRIFRINNSAPNITSYYPPYTPVNISEPDNQTFNISYNDNDGNNTVIISWYQNGTSKSSIANFTFIGNYSSAGSYNITVVVYDGFNKSRIEWTLKVSNTNRAPSAVNVSILSSDSLNRTNGTLTGTFVLSDADGDNQTLNETMWFNNSVEDERLVNLTSVYSGNTTKYQTWTFSARVYDGSNWSNWVNATIKIQNAAPDIAFFINNITLNESEWANISVSATDIDNDVINYTINNSRFTKNYGNFSWLTNTNDSGIYVVEVYANDSSLVSAQNITITVLDAFDSDRDGVPDYKDDDDDNDGINDTSDYLVGSLASINSATLSVINLTINGTANTSVIFNGTYAINISNGTNSIVEFNWTFSSTNVLNLANITINRQSTTDRGALEIKNLALAKLGFKKTAYVDDLNDTINSVCVKDIEDANYSNISKNCNATNETLVVCNGNSYSGYTCADLGSGLKITGLSNSAVLESCTDVDGDRYGLGCAAGTDCNDNDASKTTDCSSTISISSSGGGGGGGGGVASISPNEASKFYAILTPAYYPTIALHNNDIAFKKITFRANRVLRLVKIKFRSFKALEIDEKFPNAYQYINVSLENIKDKDIDNISVEFNVNISWILDKKYDKDKVVLNRLAEGKWNSLPTKRIKDSAGFSYYEALTPGFSLFAITGEKAIVEKKVEENKIEEKKLNVSEKKEKGNITATLSEKPYEGSYETKEKKLSSLTILFLTIVPSAFILITYLILFKKKNRKEESKKKAEEGEEKGIKEKKKEEKKEQVYKNF